MRKIFLVLAAGLFLFSMAGDSWASYIFPNNTEVQSYKGHTATSYDGKEWHDVLGGSVFQTFGADYDGTKLSVYTNMPKTGTTVGSYAVPVADFFIDLNPVAGTPSWDIGVVMRPGADFGKVYSLGTYKTSEDLWWSTGYYYGGRYDADGTIGAPRVPAPVPTQVVSGTVTDTIVPTWNSPSGKEGTYRVDIPLTFLDDYVFGKYNFVWGSGSCANDTTQGCVPLPGAVLLLGAGLVRLAAYARRRES